MNISSSLGAKYSRIEGIGAPVCNSPLIIMAFICEVICSYIGLFVLLLIIISTKPLHLFSYVLIVKVHYIQIWQVCQ